MDEGTGKAIPLRRSRGSARTAATRTAGITGLASISGITGITGWTAGIAAGVRRALEPTRQVWLAGLGSTTITLRGAREMWSLLVSEGAATEHWLRNTLGRSNGNGTGTHG